MDGLVKKSNKLLMFVKSKTDRTGTDVNILQNNHYTKLSEHFEKLMLKRLHDYVDVE